MQSISIQFQSIRSLPQAKTARMLVRSLVRTIGTKTLFNDLRFWLGLHDEALPIPGYWARLLVCGSGDIPEFLDQGRQLFECIRETVERNGVPIGSLKDVLDFGSGCGRVTRYWSGLPDTRVYGTDVNAYLVETCQRCVPFAQVSKNSMAPNLAYPDRSFDLVYAFSVFTHIGVEAQIAWRDELRRILRPDGLLLLTLHGDAYKTGLNAEELDDFNSGRPVVRGGQYPGGNLCASFHPESFVRETLAEGFDLLEAVPEGAVHQDLYLFRRTDRINEKGALNSCAPAH